jgi:hypothetical protein
MPKTDELTPDTSATAALRILGPTEVYAEWLARRERGRGRQATLSRNLNTLTSYRTWADKVKGNWELDPAVVTLTK